MAICNRKMGYATATGSNQIKRKLLCDCTGMIPLLLPHKHALSRTVKTPQCTTETAAALNSVLRQYPIKLALDSSCRTCWFSWDLKDWAVASQCLELLRDGTGVSSACLGLAARRDTTRPVFFTSPIVMRAMAGRRTRDGCDCRFRFLCCL